MKIHRPIFMMACLLIAGIIAGKWISCQWSVVGIVIGLSTALIAFKKDRLSSAVLMSVIFFIGCSLFHLAQWRAPDDVYWSMKNNYGKLMIVDGIVISDPILRPMPWGKKLSFTLKVKYINEAHASGKVLVQLFSDQPISYGDRIKIKGKTHRPFEFEGSGNFSYKKFLKNESIDVILSVKNEHVPEIIVHDKGNIFISQAINTQRYLSTLIDKYLLPNEAGLVKAMLIGQRTSTPKHIRTLFEQTGTAHILAISGLHVGVIAFIIYILLSIIPFPRQAKAMITVTLLIMYIFITGGKISVIRSVIMISILMLSYCLERETDSLNALGMAALVLIILNPLSIFHVSFQLSFISVLGILLIMPLLEPLWSSQQGLIKVALNVIGVSVAALLSIEALVAYYFGIMSPISVVANIVIIPLMMGVVVLGFGLLVVAPWWGWMASLFAVCLKGVLNAMATCAFLLAHIPGAYFYVKNVNHWYIMIYYILIVVIIVSLHRWRTRNHLTDMTGYLL